MDDSERRDLAREFYTLTNAAVPPSADELAKLGIERIALSRVTDDEREEIRKLAEEMAKSAASE